jgi:hypothetical protein
MPLRTAPGIWANTAATRGEVDGLQLCVRSGSEVCADAYSVFGHEYRAALGPEKSALFEGFGCDQRRV